VKKRVLISVCALAQLAAFGQIRESYAELRVKNDDAGEISNWLNSGDDLGETQSLMLSVNFLQSHPKYNFRMRAESTEYSALNKQTAELRDIFFTEVNNFQFSVDNNKFLDQPFFAVAPGLLYIQSNRITPGATGQKYYWHKWIVEPFYKDKYWEYVKSNEKARVIPYAEFRYGFYKSILRQNGKSLTLTSNLESRLASNFNFTGIGAKAYLDFKLLEDNAKFNIDFEAEGYYLTNVSDYQTSYGQLGARVNIRRLSLYGQMNKPFQKYIQNPLIKYDDKEILFNYGIVYVFAKRAKT
jgi:hypothetical protein